MIKDNIQKLKEQVQVVTEWRVTARDARDEVNSAKDKWEKDNADILSLLSLTTSGLSIEEEKLRGLTLLAYAETGNKYPAEGVSVKVFEKLDYDPKEALHWAIHHEVALKLDAPTFEKIAKVDTPSFVTISEEPRAQISTQLEEVKK